MSDSLSVAEAKGRLSELLGRASHRGERFLIRKRGKPVGAIVSPEDLERLEHVPDAKPGGILATTGALAEYDDFFEILDEVVKSRHTRMDREVSLD